MKETYLITQTKAFVIHKGEFRLKRIDKIGNLPAEFELLYVPYNANSQIIATGSEPNMLRLMRYILKRHSDSDYPIIDLFLYDQLDRVTLH
jgi:hypothetical protein